MVPMSQEPASNWNGRPALHLSPTVAWLGSVSLLTAMSSAMVYGLLPVFLVTALGASAAVVGTLEGAAEGMTSAMKVLSGALSDRFGRRKPLLIVGYTLSAFNKLLFPLAGAVPVIALARIVDRLGKGVRDAPRDAFLTDITPSAIRGSGAAQVVVLPNDHDSVRVARIAAGTAGEDLGVRVAVIPTEAQVQGLAALAVHEPARAFDADVLEMTATARHTRHGAVTVAARQAITMAGPCEPGDVLGVIEGDFALVGHDLPTVAAEILERMLGGGGELVTLVCGAGAGGLAEHCERTVTERHPAVDVVVYDGGQDRYPLLMSVE